MKKLLLIVALMILPSLALAKYQGPFDGTKLSGMPKSTKMVELGFDGFWNSSYSNRVCGMKNFEKLTEFLKELDYAGITLAEAMTYTRCGTKIGAGQQFVEHGPYFHHMVRYAGMPKLLVQRITKELIVAGNENVFINLINGVGAENGRDLFSDIESMYEDPIHQDRVKGLKRLANVLCKSISRHEITDLYQLAQSHGCSDIPPVK